MIKKEPPSDRPSIRRVQWRNDKIQWAERRGLPTAPLGTSLTVVKRLMSEDIAVLAGAETEVDKARERGRRTQRERRELQKQALWSALDGLSKELEAVNQSERNLASKLRNKIKREPKFAQEVGIKSDIGVRQCRNLVRAWRRAKQSQISKLQKR